MRLVGMSNRELKARERRPKRVFEEVNRQRQQGKTKGEGKSSGGVKGAVAGRRGLHYMQWPQQVRETKVVALKAIASTQLPHAVAEILSLGQIVLHCSLSPISHGASA